jgi:hypothetical protein
MRAAMALALVAPPTLALALFARHTLLDGLATVSAKDSRSERAAATWVGIPATTRILSAPTGAVAVEVRTLEPVAHPDLLLYISEEKPGDALPSDAVLLGAFRSSRSNSYELPANSGDGFLVLYSLPHARVVGWAPLSTVGRGEAGGSAR